MAYYQNGSSVFWEDSNDKYRYKDGKKHKNIGDTWIHEYDGWVYVYYKNELQDAYEVNKKKLFNNTDYSDNSWYSPWETGGGASGDSEGFNFNENANVRYDDKTNSLVPTLNGMEHFIGPTLYGISGANIPKNSKLAKSIFPRSARIMNAGKNTSLLSLSFRRASPKWGGILSRGFGRVLAPVGYVLTLYDVGTTSYELGKEYGPINNTINWYLEQQQKASEYQSVITVPYY